MEDLSSGWANIAEFNPHNWGAFDLTALSTESRIFAPQSYPRAPPQAWPQVSAPRSRNVPAGAYESNLRSSSATATPQWRTIGVQEPDPDPNGHQIPFVAEPRSFPPMSRRISPEAQASRVVIGPIKVHQSAATAPSATATMQWRSMEVHTSEGVSSAQMSPPSCAAHSVVAPPHILHCQSLDWQTPGQKDADTGLAPSIAYVHQGTCSCLQPGQHSADRTPQRTFSQDQGVVCSPERSTSHAQSAMCSAVSTLPALAVHAGDPSNLDVLSKYGIDLTKLPQSNSLSVSNQDLPPNTHIEELTICPCCQYCGGLEKGLQCAHSPHSHSHTHAQTGGKEVKLVVVYLQSEPQR